MAEEFERKRTPGFNEQDQEAIATKFQKLADERKRRTGLGFSSSVSNNTVAPSSHEASTTQSQEDKVRSLKASIHTLETDSAAAASQRRQAIAHIQGSQDTSITDNDSSAPINELDAQHRAAIFSSTIPVPLQEQARVENNIQLNFFNRKVVASTVSDSTGDTPLFKQIKVGDTVYAYFAGDDRFHKAEVMSVMHGGFHSAKYDIKFHGYDDRVTLSWTDLKLYSEFREDKSTGVVKGGGGGGGGEGERDVDIHVDAFGRSLSERVEQPPPPVDTDQPPPPPPLPASSPPPHTQHNNILSASSVAMENSIASDQFLQDMMGTTSQHAASQGGMQVNPDDKSNHHHVYKDTTVEVMVYEAPICAIKFSLEDIVDPAFFAGSGEMRGLWRKLHASVVHVHQ